MKELSIEEKAKAYDEALAKLKTYEGSPTLWNYRDICEKFFPQLAESEDERIRKYLKLIIGEWSYDDLYAKGFRKEDILAWLEKQGEKAKYHDVCDKCVRHPTCQSDCFLQQSEQKPAWSEEDEKNMETLINVLYAGTDLAYEREINWLRTLKDRVQLQPKQEWSEDEKAMIDEMHEFFDKHKFPSLKHGLDKYVKFLESLRPRNQWKPSEEQMEALRIAAYEPTKNWKEELQTLYMELKKLTE